MTCKHFVAHAVREKRMAEPIVVEHEDGYFRSARAPGRKKNAKPGESQVRWILAPLGPNIHTPA